MGNGFALIGGMVAGSDKRIPGQSNADYERQKSDPNAESIGTNSLFGGMDLTGIFNGFKSLLDRLARRGRQ